MHVFLELLLTVWQFFSVTFWACVHCIIPRAEKCVSGEVVLITGSGSGMGRLMALAFAKRGAVVVGWDISKAANEETASLVQNEGGEMYTYVCDVSKKENIYKLADQVRTDVGNVTILVNNAGVVTGKRFMQCSDEAIARTIDVNLMAHFWTTKAFLPSMMEQNHGHIVNMASMGGIIGCGGLADYAASKFANVGFTESLDFEMVAENRTGIHFTVVCPHLIGTGMFAGCKLRFEAMIPQTSPESAVNQIMKAVLTNQRILYIPKSMALIAALRAIFPPEACIALHKFFGSLNYMDTFVGRQGEAM